MLQKRVNQATLESAWCSDCQVQHSLSGQYAEWTRLVEEELEHLTGHPLRRRGARVRTPRLVQVPLAAVKRIQAIESSTLAEAAKRLLDDMELCSCATQPQPVRSRAGDRALSQCDRLLDQDELPQDLGFAVARAQQLLQEALHLPADDEVTQPGDSDFEIQAEERALHDHE